MSSIMPLFVALIFAFSFFAAESASLKENEPCVDSSASGRDVQKPQGLKTATPGSVPPTVIDSVTTGCLLIGLCPAQQSREATSIKSRRYDVNDIGYPDFFHGWADVQGIGAASDYCRIVGAGETLRLTCALGGTQGQNELLYESAWNFQVGHSKTWYMKDEDGDGRDDYCRCIGDDPSKSQVVCTKAGNNGFYGSKLQGGRTNTFTPSGPTDCKAKVVYPEFGRTYGFVI